MEKESTQIRKKRSYGKYLTAFFAVVVLMLLASYGFLTYEARNKSLPRLTLESIEAGSKTRAELNILVQSYKHQEDTANITLKYNGKTAVKQYKDLGLGINQGETVDNIYNFGKTGKIFPSFSYLLATIKGQADIKPESSWVNTSQVILKDLFKDQKVEAQNPVITANSNTINIEPEKPGAEPDYLQMRKEIEKCFLFSCKTTVSFGSTATKSNIKATDLEPLKNELTSAINSGLILNYNGRDNRVAKDSFISLIDVERTGLSQKITYDDKKIEDYLNSLTSKINKKAKDRVISSYDNSVISEGQEGSQLDIKKSKSLIEEALGSSGGSVELAISTSPIEETVQAPAFTPGKYPGKYIEVNLSEQELYTFEGTNLVGSYKVSTGKWSMPTPTGEYSINNKDPRAYSQEYNLYMPYWMAFIGSKYGIHELPEWADGRKEGEAHLGTPVSHGCIRLGRGSAETVYNWTEIGTIVYIHS